MKITILNSPAYAAPTPTSTSTLTPASPPSALSSPPPVPPLSSPSSLPVINAHTISRDLALLRRDAPLIHNIANYVAMPTIANMLLAIGAAPLMAQAKEELADISNITRALVLNIGTLDANWISAMQLAQQLANQRAIPVILDPVGAGASQYRTNTSLSLLRAGVNIIRGNASEISALGELGESSELSKWSELADTTNMGTKGVETTIASTSKEAQQAAEYLTHKYTCVVVISGATDIIVSHSGATCYIEKPAATFFTKVTAMGCAATAIVGAFAAINKDYFAAAAHAMAALGIAGEKAMEGANGPGSFYVKLLDALYQLDANDCERIVEKIT